MDLITSFPLGDDIAWTLLATTLIGLAAIVAGVLIPRRVERDEDSEELDAELGTRLGSLLSATAGTALVVGVPALLLLLLVPGGMDMRLLRSGLMLAGILAGAASAWRGIGILVPFLGVDGEDRRRSVARAGALAVATALSLALVPVALVVWFLRSDAGTPLLAFAAGAAVFALAARVAGSFTDVAADSSALLAGADEAELDREAEDNPGAVHARIAGVFRRGPARAAEITAAAAVVMAAGIAIGVAVLTVEGMIVPLLGGGIAVLAALLVTVIPQFGAEGREHETLRLGALIPSVIGAGALVATSVLWLPTQYKALRFTQVGLETFTDPALTGGQPVARADLEPQIESARAQLPQLLEQSDESTRSIVDTVAIYGIHPHAVVGIAIAVGALVAICAQLQMSFAADRRNTPVLAVSRTSRTGGALAALTALGSGGTVAALVLVVVVIGLVVLMVTGAGIGMLTMLLTAYAGLGALVVVAGHAAVHTAAAIADRPGSEPSLRGAARAADVSSATGLQVAGLLGAVAVLAPVTNAIAGTERGTSVWEDRALHDMTPGSLIVVGGVGIGVATVLLIGTSLLESARRIGAAAVLDTRTALLDGGTGRVHLGELELLARKASAAPLVIALLMPVLVGFGLGAGALPGYIAAVLLTALVLAVWTGATDASLRSAVDVIESGRYGGRDSWAHSAALGNAALGTGLRAAIGQLALPAAVVSALVSVVAIGTFVTLPTDGTSIYLRWGIAILALLAVAVATMVTASVPEPDLEDIADLDEPLFASAADDREPESDLFAGSWDDEDERESVPVYRRAVRKAAADRDRATKRTTAKGTGTKGEGTKGEGTKGAGKKAKAASTVPTTKGSTTKSSGTKGSGSQDSETKAKAVTAAGSSRASSDAPDHDARDLEATDPETTDVGATDHVSPDPETTDGDPKDLDPADDDPSATTPASGGEADEPRDARRASGRRRRRKRSRRS